MKKIYFSPSDQIRNSYAVGNTDEAEQCRQIALLAVEAAKRCGFEAMTNTTDDSKESMEHRIAESNAWGADVHVPIHTNAYNGQVQGTRLFCSAIPGTGHDICKAVMSALAPITPGGSDSITTARFTEIVAANAPTCYIEVAFHDNTEEARWIIDHKQEIAEAIVQGLCNYYGVTYVAPTQEETDVRYDYIEQLPKYAQPTIQKLVDKGLLSGKKDGRLDLSEDMVRILVIHDRAGLYD